MTMKIILLILICLVSILNVSAYEVYEGEVESITYSQTNQNIGYSSATVFDMNVVSVKSGGIAKDLTSITTTLSISAWAGSLDYNCIKQDVTYEQNSVTVGTGYMYYWLRNTDSIPGYDEVYVKCYFDDGLDLPAGAQQVDIIGAITSLAKFDRSNQIQIASLTHDKQGIIGRNHIMGSTNMIEGYHSAKHEVSFYNNYSYWYNEDLFNFVLTRNEQNPSMLYINNQYEDLINETSYNDDITNVYSDDLNNHTWDIEIYDINDVTHNFQIDLNPEPVNITPTLIFNQSTYYINETMEYEYTNLNYLHTSDKYYDLVFYYYTSENSIEHLYIQSLSDYDNTGYLSTYGWTPKKLYYGVIDNSLNYKTSQTIFLNNVKLSNHMILTYDYEFIYISCDGDYCQYENGDSFIITYNSFNDYTLNVKDNNSNIVQSLGTINNFGTISYTIPYDNEKQYYYPYWNISFNESYENVIVFWSIKEDEINYQDEVVNESIQANIDEMKEGVKPLFDLAFGLSTIIVDNPDYDNNGVTSSSELDRWFNSIISIVILLALYIFYKGLKDRGSK